MDINEEIKKLKDIRDICLKRKDNYPNGKVHICKSKKGYKFYLKEKGKDRKYIRRDNENMVYSLVQKEYEDLILKEIEPSINNLEKVRNMYNSNILTDTYKKIPEGKRIYIEPFERPIDEYILEWKNEKLQKKKAYKKFLKNQNNNKYDLDEKDEEESMTTERGEIVRSKSEKIIADKFSLMGIEYVYEVPVYLKNFGYVVPDFCILNKKNRKTFFWEHLGKMDAPEYVNRQIEKLRAYEKNGYMLGKNLLITMETKENQLPPKAIERIIKEYLV